MGLGDIGTLAAAQVSPVIVLHRRERWVRGQLRISTWQRFYRAFATHSKFLAALFAVWLGRVLQQEVDYLMVENRVLRETAFAVRFVLSLTRETEHSPAEIRRGNWATWLTS